MRRPNFYLSLLLAGLICFSTSALFSQSKFATAHPGMEWHARGTGQTTGHVIDLVAFNTSAEEVSLDIGPLVIPSEGTYQGYVIPNAYPATIPPFGYILLPLEGYCTDISKLALPKGSLLFNSEDWVTADSPLDIPGPDWDLMSMGFERFFVSEEINRVLTYPGTDIAFTYQIDIDAHLSSTATMLVDAVTRIEEAYDEWVQTAPSSFVFASMEAQEMKYAVVQHVFWYYSSILHGDPYYLDHFTEIITQETEVVVNAYSEYYTQAAIEHVQEDAKNVWEGLMLIGTHAKVIKDPDVLGDSWGVHYQRWVRGFLEDIDPNQLAAAGDMVQLADTLADLQEYLGDLFTQRIQNGISVKMGDFYKFQLEGLNNYDKLKDWIYLEALTHTTAFGFLEPLTQEVILEELKEKMDRWIRTKLRELSPDDLKAWVELEALVGWDVINSNIELSTLTLLRESLSVFFRDYAMNSAQALDPSDSSSLRTWVELEMLLLCPWYDAYVSKEDRKEIRRILSEKFTSFLNEQIDQLDPEDSLSIRKWVELEALIFTDWFEEYVPEDAKKAIIKKLGEKFISYLHEELDKLNLADPSMLEKWISLEAFIFTDWFEVYVSKADREAFLVKMVEKFTAWLKVQLDDLDPSDENMLEKWRRLEALTHTDWFETYVSEADKKAILKRLKEKFTAWLEPQLDNLDSNDPDFLEKWIGLQRLTLTDRVREYVDKPAQAEKELTKSYLRWEKEHTDAIDYTQIDWEQVQWTGERIKVHFGGPLLSVSDQGGIKPWVFFVAGAVPIIGGITYVVLRYPLPPEANPETLFIACPEDGLVNVLNNDTGKDIQIVSIEQPPGVVITNVGLGLLQIDLDLLEPITQFSFQYTIKDIKGRTATAEVLVHVTLPFIEALGEVYEVNSNSTLSGNVLDNDMGTFLQVTDYTEPEGGTLTVLPNGTFMFIPDAGFCESTIFNYTVTDACRQTAGASAAIMVHDVGSPVISCPPEITISCEDSAEPSFTGQATATDNCTLNPTLEHADEYAGLPCNQTLTRTWTATDEAGLTASCVQIIHMVDVTAPTVTCPPDLSIPCDSSPDPSWTGSPLEYSDNCTPPLDLEVTYSDEFLGTGGVGNLERTWAVVDPCENVGTCIQLIVIIDEEGPVITCPPDFEISCGLSPDPGNTGYPEVADNCTQQAEIEVQYEDVFVGSGCMEDIIRTWTAMDGTGNTSSCEQLIIREDVTPPEIICPDDLQVGCGQEQNLDITGSAQVFDECGESITLTYTDDLSGFEDCEGEIIRTWTAVDPCGNGSFCQQKIQVLPVNCNFQAVESIQPATCGAPVGEISLDMSPSGDYTFQWNTGSIEPVASNLLSELYHVTIHGANASCTEIFHFFIPEAPPVFALNTTVDPDICIEPGNITILLDTLGAELFNIIVVGPNTFSIPSQGPGEVSIGAFGDLPPGNYIIVIFDPEGPPGCNQEYIVNVPVMPPYILQVGEVVNPSTSSSTDGVINLSIIGDPIFPVNIMVNGSSIGTANSNDFFIPTLGEGTYEIWIVADGGMGCESNPVTVPLTASTNFSGLESQGFTDLGLPPWSDWVEEVVSSDPGAYIPEHPVLEPQEPYRAWQEIPISFGLGYALNAHFQLRWQLGYSGGYFSQVWEDHSLGASYQLETHFRALSNEGGFRYFFPSGKFSPFLGMGLNWQHLSFINTRLLNSGSGQALSLDAVNHFSTYLSAGMRWRLGQYSYLELDGRMGSPMGWGETPEFSLRPMIGFRF